MIITEQRVRQLIRESFGLFGDPQQDLVNGLAAVDLELAQKGMAMVFIGEEGFLEKHFDITASGGPIINNDDQGFLRMVFQISSPIPGKVEQQLDSNTSLLKSQKALRNGALKLTWENPANDHTTSIIYFNNNITVLVNRP
jgi:hypothetical protein